MFSIYMGYKLKCTCKYKCKLFTIIYDLHVVYKKRYVKVGVENEKNSKPKQINLNFYHMRSSAKHHKYNFSVKYNH